MTHRARLSHILVLLVSGGAVCAAVPARAQDRLTAIRYGQPVQGELASGDEQLTDDSYVDEYVFEGRRGERVTVTLRSSAFDTHLAIGDYPDNRSWRDMGMDDDGAGGTDSRLTLTLPANGRYVIRANSVEPNRTGRYSLDVAVASRPAPAPAPVAAARAAGAPPAGRYTCLRLSTAGNEIAADLHLLPGGRYSSMDVAGTYRYDAGTRTLTWLTGSLVTSRTNWVGVYVPAGANARYPTIRIRSRQDIASGSMRDLQWCNHRG